MSAARGLIGPALALVAIAVAACGTMPGVPSSTSDPPAPTGTILLATPAITIDPVASASPTGTTGAGLEGPPEADLTVEGGDPVPGQLGTYTWDDGGSDSPWLPGAPIPAAPGEVLTVTLSPEVRMTDWKAVIVPRANGDGTGAVRVGAGPSPLDVTAPGPGAWTLAVTIEFGARGSATWFWLLEVA